MNITPNNAIDINGTWLQGYIDASYAELVETFGKPNSEGDSYKVDAEWILTGPNGEVITIYNYKDGINYCGTDGAHVENIRNWHIGGFNKNVVDLVSAALKNVED
mgnify:CR=1 FL=1